MRKTAWWVVCVPKDKPDGPGNILGPFPTKELAVGDANWVGFSTCNNAHVIVAGPGPARPMMNLLRPHMVMAVQHYLDHPDEIPEPCAGHQCWKELAEDMA